MPDPERWTPHSPPAASPRAPHRRSPQRPRVLLIGDRESRNDALARLRNIGAGRELVQVGWRDEVAPSVGPRVRAIVLTGEPPERSLPEAVANLCGAIEQEPVSLRPPLLVLREPPVADETALELYAAGADLVAVTEPAPRDLSGPTRQEVDLLVPMALAHSAARDDEEASLDPDEALARHARLRLMLASRRYEFVDVTLEAGCAHVRGRVDSLWRRAHVTETLRSIPGILTVDTSELIISGRPPRSRIEQELEQVLGRHPDGTRTITAALEGHRVVLAGSLPTRAAMKATLAAVATIDGVDGIEHDLVVSIERHRRDRTLAECVAARLRELTGDGPRPKVDVLGPIVVLRDERLSRPERESVAEDLLCIPGIEEVFGGQ